MEAVSPCLRAHSETTCFRLCLKPIPITVPEDKSLAEVIASQFTFVRLKSPVWIVLEFVSIRLCTQVLKEFMARVRSTIYHTKHVNVVINFETRCNNLTYDLAIFILPSGASRAPYHVKATPLSRPISMDSTFTCPTFYTLHLLYSF